MMGAALRPALAVVCTLLSALLAAAPLAAAEGRHALIIGVGQYSPASQAAPLPGVPKDLVNARRMARAMGVDDSAIVELRDQRASKANIVAALQKLRDQVQPGDRVLIYFSGHGTRFEARGRCVEGLLPYTAAAYGADDVLSEEELARYTVPISERADKIVTIVDACHSGGVLAAKFRSLTQEVGIVPKYSASRAECAVAVNDRKTRSFEPAMTRLGASRENFVQIAAANYDEVSWDTKELGGLATHSLTACLLGEAKDLDRSGAVSLKEVEQCAQAKVNELIRPWEKFGKFPSTIQVRGARNLIVVDTRADAERRRAEEQGIADEKRQMEEQRLANERRHAEEQRLATEKRLAEERRAAEEQRLATEKRLAEERRLAEEQRLVEQRRLAEERRAAEERRRAAERQLAEEHRIAEQRLAEDKARLERIDRESREAEERKLAEDRRLAEERRRAAEKRLAEELRLAEEGRRAEELRLAEERRQAEERRRAEERKLAAERVLAEERRLSEQNRIAEEQGRQEERRSAEERKLAEERKAQEQRLAEERRLADEGSRPSPLASEATLQDIFAQRDPRLTLEVDAPRRLVIGRDSLNFSVRSSTDGYVYAVLLASDGQSFYLLFPNKVDQDNRIKANVKLNFPRPGWAIKAGGPQGMNHLLLVVSQAPRDPKLFVPDLASLGGSLAYSVSDMAGRKRLIDFFLGKGIQGRNAQIAASLLKIEEVK